MAAGDAFTREQQVRLAQAVDSAEAQTGMRFSVRIGEIEGDPQVAAEYYLANLAPGAHDGAVVLLVAPGSRLVEIMTTQAARRRVDDQAAGLVVLTMTSSFSVGDLVGGIVNGLRQLADAAGAPGGGTGRIQLGTDDRAPALGSHPRH